MPTLTILYSETNPMAILLQLALRFLLPRRLTVHSISQFKHYMTQQQLYAGVTTIDNLRSLIDAEHERLTPTYSKISKQIQPMEIENFQASAGRDIVLTTSRLLDQKNMAVLQSVSKEFAKPVSTIMKDLFCVNLRGLRQQAHTLQVELQMCKAEGELYVFSNSALLPTCEFPMQPVLMRSTKLKIF